MLCASVRPVRDDPALYGVGPDGAWLALRSLCTMHGQGWTRYVAAQEPARGWHVIDLTPRTAPTYRQVRILPRYYTAHHRPASGTFGTPGEAWWYGLGQQAGRRKVGVFEKLAQEQAPPMLGLDETAAELGITVQGVRALHESYALYPVYAVDPVDHRTRRLAFADQVVARSGGGPREEEAGRERAGYASMSAADRRRFTRDWHTEEARTARRVEAEQRWITIRGQLPDLVRVDTIAEHVVLPAAPDPLPVDPAMPSPLRQREALAIGHTAGWFRVTGQRVGGFKLAGRGEIPGPAVEPWLLGFADARGEGHRVMYRGLD